MIALLLAAGYGKRLGKLTTKTPKCLIKVGNKPLIDYWLNTLSCPNIDKIIINTHYLSEIVFSHIKTLNNKKVEISYEKELLGTAGTFQKVIKKYNPNEIIVIHADNFSIFNFDRFYKAFKARKKNVHVTMMTFITSTPESCGIVSLKNNLVVNFFEKVINPPSNLANGAIYFFDKEAINEIKKMKKIIDISQDIIPKFIGRINCFHNSIYHCDIGTKRSLLDANEYIKNNKKLLHQFFPGL